MKLTENQSYDINELQYLLPNGIYLSGHGESGFTIHGDIDTTTQASIDTYINTMTRAERNATIIEAKRVQDITEKADAHVLANYSELKQRKYLSIAASLSDKKNELGLALSQAELDLLQEIRDVNTWITAVRTVENAAIADGVSTAEEIVF